METDSGAGQAIEIWPGTETDYQSDLNSHIRFLSEKLRKVTCLLPWFML